MPKQKSPPSKALKLNPLRAKHLTPDRSARIIEAFAASGSLQHAAAVAGVELKTLYDWLERGRTEKTGTHKALNDGLSFTKRQAGPMAAQSEGSRPPFGTIIGPLTKAAKKALDAYQKDPSTDLRAVTVHGRLAPPSAELKKFLDDLKARGVKIDRLWQILTGQLPPHINVLHLHRIWCTWQAQKQRILQRMERATGRKVDPEKLSRVVRDLRPADVGIGMDDADLLIMDRDKLELVKRQLRVFYQMLAEFQLPEPTKRANEERGLPPGFRGLFTVGLDASFSRNEFFTPIIAALMDEFKDVGAEQAYHDVAQLLHCVCPDYPDDSTLVKRRYRHWSLHRAEYMRRVRARCGLRNPVGDGRDYRAGDVFTCLTVFAKSLLRAGVVKEVRKRFTHVKRS